MQTVKRPYNDSSTSQCLAIYIENTGIILSASIVPTPENYLREALTVTATLLKSSFAIDIKMPTQLDL